MNWHLNTPIKQAEMSHAINYFLNESSAWYMKPGIEAVNESQAV